MWGVFAWEQLQDDDGGVRMGVETYKHPLYSLANYDVLPYWTYTKDASVSARAAGLFAQASRLISAYDPARAAELRTHAEKAYTYAEANAASDHFMFYAAGELLRLTGEVKYKNYFETAWKNTAASPWSFPRYSLSHLALSDYMSSKDRAMPDYFLGYYKSDITPVNFHDLYGVTDPSWASETIWSRIDAVIKPEADAVANDTINSQHAHRNPRPTNYSMDWG